MARRFRELTAFAEDLGSLPNTHGGSGLSITPVPEDLMPTSAIWGHQEHTWYNNLHAGITSMHIK